MDKTTERVLEIFKDITRIPRESGHEGPMIEFLKDFAAKHNLECKVDETGNVCISKQASKGREGIPTLTFQCHQDMVCEKVAGSKHDFLKDPIDYVIEDGWMVARETTLGADDGIGIAACLALLESDEPMGKIETLYTISEETGMDGAEGLKEGFIEGRTLINLDSEDEGQLFIGCAGGVNTTIEFDKKQEPVRSGYQLVKLEIGGGTGGHSGDDINKDRANVVQQLFRFLYYESKYNIQLVEFVGGGKPNAISRSAEAVIAVPDPVATMSRFDKFFKDLKQEFHTTDKGLNHNSSIIDINKAKAVESGIAERLIQSVFSCPHGVEAMSQDIEGLVETSTNLASINTETDNGKILVVTSQRSSVDSAKDMIAGKVEAHFRLAGAEVKHLFPYPGWEPNVDSPILKTCVEAYRRLFSQEPEVKAIHAGLECGLFLEKFPYLDMISFGPTLRGVHAPGERLELASLEKFVVLMMDIALNFK